MTRTGESPPWLPIATVLLVGTIAAGAWAWSSGILEEPRTKVVTAPDGPCYTMLLDHRTQGNRTWFDVTEMHEPPPRVNLLKYELEFTSPDGNTTRTRGNLSDSLHEVDGNGVRYLERNGSSEHVNLGDGVVVNRTNVTGVILLEWDPEFEDWTHLTIVEGWTGCL